MSFGFFTRRKPTVTLLVNGEPVLSAINSTSYAVHHSSGRLAAVRVRVRVRVRARVRARAWVKSLSP